MCFQTESQSIENWFLFRSEYGAFWKCVTAGFMYMVTQLAKMLFLATFFPVAVDEEEDPNVEVPFDFLTVSDLVIFTAANKINFT